MEIKGTIWAKGSMSFGGVVAFEHHGSTLQSSFWCFSHNRKQIIQFILSAMCKAIYTIMLKQYLRPKTQT
jgi:hypothetical protein